MNDTLPALLVRRRNEDELSAEERFVELTLYFLNKVNFKGGRKEEGEEEF